MASLTAASRKFIVSAAATKNFSASSLFMIIVFSAILTFEISNFSAINPAVYLTTQNHQRLK